MLGSFGQLLRAVAGGSDPAAVPPPGEVIATLEVGQPPPDYDYSRDVYRYTGYVLEAALAANRSTVQLYNPASSGAVVVLHKLHVKAGNDSVLLCSTGTAATDNDGTEHATDTRLRLSTYVNRLPAAQIRSRQGALLGDGMVRLLADHESAGGDHFFHSDEPYVIWPGAGLTINTVVDNSAIVGSFWWTERSFDPEELRGVRPGLFT